MGFVKKFDLWMSFVIWVGVLGICSGYKFYVGGRDGWVISPSEDYTHWAQRNRFQVNDTLYFRYEKGRDSVLVVTKEDYYTCNTENPINSLTDGDSLFVFDRSGPFFFVSGNSSNCLEGQKLVVVVMAVRNATAHHHHQSRQQPSPSPSPSSPSRAAPSMSPSPVLPVPAVQPPASSPGVNPSDLEAPAPAPAPALAQNSGSVRLAVSSFGLVLAVMMSTAVLGFLVV